MTDDKKYPVLWYSCVAGSNCNKDVETGSPQSINNSSGNSLVCLPTGTFPPDIETMERSDLDALIDERVRYTVQYAADHSPFYRHWFRENRIEPKEIRVHEDLLSLPLVIW